MSWYATFPTTDAVNCNAPSIITPATLSKAEQEQFNAGRTAAIWLIEGQSVGDVFKDFTVIISGHANPDHQPCVGSSNDTVTIVVSQRTPEPGETVRTRDAWNKRKAAYQAGEITADGGTPEPAGTPEPSGEAPT